MLSNGTSCRAHAIIWPINFIAIRHDLAQTCKIATRCCITCYENPDKSFSFHQTRVWDKICRVPIRIDSKFSHQWWRLGGKLCTRIRFRTNFVVYDAFSVIKIRQFSQTTLTFDLWQSCWFHVRFIGVNIWRNCDLRGLNEKTGFFLCIDSNALSLLCIRPDLCQSESFD